MTTINLQYLCPHTALPLVALLLWCSGCAKPKQAQKPPTPPEVEVVTVEQKDVPIYKEWVGTLEGDVNATISAQVNGYLTNRLYNEGSPVTNGQVLFQIESAPFEAVLAQARAVLAQTEAMKGKTKLDVERYTPLARTDAISKQELDDAIQADLSADAQIQGAQAAIQQAELNLGFTTIRSPIDGIAGLAKAQVGDLVGPSFGPLTTVSKLDPIRAYFSVSEQLVYRALSREATAGGRNAGDAQKIELDLILASGDVYPEKGRIRFSDNKVDPKTGTILMVGEFPNPKHLLASGMFARVRAKVGEEKGALLVPQRAVTEMQGRFLVAVIGADRKIAIRPVAVGERVGSEWIVRSPQLKAGDHVVAEGIQKVRDGAEVTSIPFVEKPAGAPAGSAPAPRPEGAKE